MDVATSAPRRDEGRLAALVGRPIFWITAIGVLFAFPLVRSLTRKLPPEPPVLGEISPFRTTHAAGDRTGAPLASSEELAGRVWVLSFVEPGDPACEKLGEGMTRIQRRARNLGDDFRIVTVVPAGADAAKVGEFAARHHANPRRWWYLGVPATVETEVSQSMHRAAVLAPMVSGASSRVHGQHLSALVDRRGRLRGFYDITSDAGRDAVLADAGLIANLPTQRDPARP
jgi:cytochrome oxidase Cu insertion factor (SCO1/SenC/PrrC family)